MSEAPVVMVGMPAYNEEARVGTTVEAVKKYHYFVVVVDGGSKDATAKVAADAGAKVVMHGVNQGYGGALQTLFKTAQKYQPDILIIIDSDGQHNPADVPRLVDKIQEGYDVVIGSRFLSEEGKKKIPEYRKLGMKVLDKATQMATPNIHITDSQSGFRAYAKRAYNLIHLSGDGMSAGSEILMQLNDNHMRISEIPISVRYDLEGTSSQNPFRHGLSVLANVLLFVTVRRPIFSFGVPGIVVLSFGLVLAVRAFDIVAHTGTWAIPITLLSWMLLIMGMLLCGGALILYAVERVIGMAMRG